MNEKMFENMKPEDLVWQINKLYVLMTELGDNLNKQIKELKEELDKVDKIHDGQYTINHNSIKELKGELEETNQRLKINIYIDENQRKMIDELKEQLYELSREKPERKKWDRETSKQKLQEIIDMVYFI